MKYLAVGNNELGDPIAKGDRVKCGKCTKRHRVELGIDKETGNESGTLQFYSCGKKTYLVGIDGRKIP